MELLNEFEVYEQELLRRIQKEGELYQDGLIAKTSRQINNALAKNEDKAAILLEREKFLAQRPAILPTTLEYKSPEPKIFEPDIHGNHYR